jgi:hypothetical protein
MAVLDNNFLDWLEQQPERIALRESIEQLLHEYRRHDIEARQTLFKSMSLFGASEKIDDGKTEWEISSEAEDRSMTKIYGICPEMMIDGYSHVIDSLLAEAYRQAGLASELFTTARSKEQAYNTARKTLIAQSDDLRPRFDALQQQEESK